MKRMLVKSLAGTYAQYVLVQMRRKNNKIKVQGGGVSVNRDYGFTEEFVWSALLDMIDQAKSNYYGESLHPDSDLKYLLVQARLKGGNIKVQCLCEAINRDYGFTVEFPAGIAPVFASFLEKNG